MVDGSAHRLDAFAFNQDFAGLDKIAGRNIEQARGVEHDRGGRLLGRSFACREQETGSESAGNETGAANDLQHEYDYALPQQDCRWLDLIARRLWLPRGGRMPVGGLSCKLGCMSLMRIVGVIPARLASTRLSRKVLRTLAGRPMVEWVWRAARASGLMDPVVVATDAEEVAQVCRERAIPVAMTSVDCASGSDRVREVARHIDADIYVNIQGDEPTLTADFFPPLLKLFERPEVEVATLAVPCPAEEIDNPNAVKVVTALDGRALYFSRATIPFDRDRQGFVGYRKHLGIYAYRKAALERFAALLPGHLERVERLEQLRLLENGIAIYVAEAPRDTIGVDTEEDLARAERLLLDSGF
jgi:3-deoxy-manno-octulosonate cytidylyltransferase (CMP-KDO synthetase)